MTKKLLFLTWVLVCASVCTHARPPKEALNIDGLQIHIGNNVAEVQRALGTTSAPVAIPPLPPEMRPVADALSLSQVQTLTQSMELKAPGISAYFDQSGATQMIGLHAPFSGNIGGIKIGSPVAAIFQALGQPFFVWRQGEGSLHPISYYIDEKTMVRFSFDEDEKVKSMIITALSGNPLGATTTGSPAKAKFSLVKDCNVEYPSAAIHAGERGSVELEFTVGADDKLISTRIVKSSGFDNLDQGTITGTKHCDFLAARIDGKAVQSTFTADYTWMGKAFRPERY